ncbi:MAG: hypothetical protein FJ271_24380, partial [Planctomycetes bacterium]|nr:hypothetical protein [Planctomycetota bacterium]
MTCLPAISRLSRPGGHITYFATLRKLCGAPHKFRVGDFYELFHEDAETASKILGLTLTTRDKTVAMAGFPHHSLETYLHKLLHAGHRVAICDQVED